MRGDLLDRIEFGVLLIILSLILLLYPEAPSEFLLWLFSLRSGPAMPPRAILWPLIYLLALTGIWEFLKAGTRLWAGADIRRGATDILDGSLLSVIAFILREYAERLIPITALPPLLGIAVGSMIILRTLVSQILEGRGRP